LLVSVISITSHSEDETLALGRRLATSFKSGDVIVLTGPLGSGKTVFVKGLAQGRELDPENITSPSFGFVNEYPGKLPLYHFDLYRLDDVTELYEVGWDEYLERDGVVVVEWGERAGGFLPDRYYLIAFRIVDDAERQIEISLVES
jgi:tRNA threonylcarbamoyladenosine biosynthesis protein TsaE